MHKIASIIDPSRSVLFSNLQPAISDYCNEYIRHINFLLDHSSEIIAAFDSDMGRQRKKKLTQPVLGMEKLAEFVRERGVKMAILTVPGTVAQEVANMLVQAGVEGILNFAPIVLQVPEEVMVNNVNLAIELENLSYFVQH